MTSAPWSCAATSNAQRVRVDVFSKISAMFLPTSCGFFIAVRIWPLSGRAPAEARKRISVGVKSTRLAKSRWRRLTGILDRSSALRCGVNGQEKSTASRMIGQVMQWPPPRPRPSSEPEMVMTSMPCLRSSVLVCTLRL